MTTFFQRITFPQRDQVELITKLKANMKNQLMLLSDKLLLRKRAVIESVIDQLKNISQIEHTVVAAPPTGWCIWSQA